MGSALPFCFFAVRFDFSSKVRKDTRHLCVLVVLGG